MNETSRQELIERRIDPDRAGSLALTSLGVAFRNMGEVMEFSKLMAIAGPAVGKGFRNNVGACLAVTLQAVNLGFDPFAFSRKCYIVTDKDGHETIAYEAQLIAAIINSKAAFTKRPDIEFMGEGPQRQCRVTFYFVGSDPKVYVSPPLSQITPRKSPLWTSDPDQQLSYYSLRAGGRRFCPEVILGMYDQEEMAAAIARDVTPVKSSGIISRLPGPQAASGVPEVGTVLDTEEAKANGKEQQDTAAGAAAAGAEGAPGEDDRGGPGPADEGGAAGPGGNDRGGQGKAIDPDALTAEEKTGLNNLATMLASAKGKPDVEAIMETFKEQVGVKGRAVFQLKAEEAYQAALKRLAKKK